MAEVLWAGRPVRVAYGEVWVDDSRTGSIEKVGDVWRWHLGLAADGPSGEAPTRRRALAALLAAHSKAVDAWATP